MQFNSIRFNLSAGGSARAQAAFSRAVGGSEVARTPFSSAFGRPERRFRAHFDGAERAGAANSRARAALRSRLAVPSELEQCFRAQSSVPRQPEQRFRAQAAAPIWLEQRIRAHRRPRAARAVNSSVFVDSTVFSSCRKSPKPAKRASGRAEI